MDIPSPHGKAINSFGDTDTFIVRPLDEGIAQVRCRSYFHRSTFRIYSTATDRAALLWTGRNRHGVATRRYRFKLCRHCHICRRHGEAGSTNSMVFRTVIVFQTSGFETFACIRSDGQRYGFPECCRGR